MIHRLDCDSRNNESVMMVSIKIKDLYYSIDVLNYFDQSAKLQRFN
jgi:hypothetical protein